MILAEKPLAEHAALALAPRRISNGRRRRGCTCAVFPMADVALLGQDVSDHLLMQAALHVTGQKAAFCLANYQGPINLIAPPLTGDDTEHGMIRLSSLQKLGDEQIELVTCLAEPPEYEEAELGPRVYESLQSFEEAGAIRPAETNSSAPGRSAALDMLRTASGGLACRFLSSVERERRRDVLQLFGSERKRRKAQLLRLMFTYHRETAKVLGFVVAMAAQMLSQKHQVDLQQCALQRACSSNPV